jgi:hypothetical protein
MSKAGGKRRGKESTPKTSMMEIERPTEVVEEGSKEQVKGKAEEEVKNEEEEEKALDGTSLTLSTFPLIRKASKFHQIFLSLLPSFLSPLILSNLFLPPPSSLFPSPSLFFFFPSSFLASFSL